MIFSLLPGIVAVYFLLTGLFICFKAKPHRVRTALLALCATTFIWQMAWALLFQVTDPDLANRLIKFGYLLIIFLPTTLYHFLTEISAARQERRYVYLSYGIAVIFAVILLTSDLFVSGYYDYYWGYFPKAGMVHPFHVLQTIIVISRGLFIVYQKQKNIFGPLKSQLRYCLASLLIYAFAATDYLCNYGIEFYPLGIIFITISLTIIAYAMIKKELLDIQVVVTRLAAYMITVTLIIMSFAIVNMSLPGLNDTVILLLNIVVALAWGRYGDKLREKLQTTSEQKWVSDWYDPNEVVTTLSQRVYPLLDRKEIMLTVASTLIERMAVKQALAMVREECGYCCYMNGQKTVHVIPHAHPLIIWLADHPVMVTHCADLPSEIKWDNYFTFSPDSLLMPLHSSTQLDGLIVLGAHVSEMHYRQKDRQLLEIVVRQVGVCLDRAETHHALLAKAKIVALHEEKLNLTRAIMGNIAHELRTPLTTISMAAKNFGKYLPELWAGYELGVQQAQASASQATFIIPAHHRHILKSGVEDIGRIVCRAQTMITLLLTKVRSDAIDESKFQHYSMQMCIEKALVDYPFRADEKAGIYFDAANDFEFEGSDTLLIYVLYNLIKNSLYYIAKAGKGEIRVWMDRGRDINTLHFKDTGTGVSEAVLPRIFDDFFTTKPKDVGNGLGLSFCQRVVNSFSGHIKCYSINGEYTEFFIELPHAVV